MSKLSIEDLVMFSTHSPDFEEYETPKEKCIKGQPLQRTWHHFTSADDAFFAGVWEAEPGCWSITYTENEFCQIVSGRSILRDREGRERVVQAGDNFVIPAGFQGQWEVLETTRKIYVIYQP
ncbi:MAG TPA: cupin domain-containing protein [Xanthomonadales bacterium]|nr:cupin domain-containing protein [Xanthomonadales bacterium]